MTVLTHTGRPFERGPYSSVERQPRGAANVCLAIARRVCLIALTSLLAISAVAGVIALKTAAYLSHFAH